MKRSIILTLLGVATLLVLAVFVWPTRYKYDHIKMGEPVYEAPVRIDRFTGKTQILFPQGWRIAGLGSTGESQPPSKQKLPPPDVAKLTGQASITNYGSIAIELYNGSSWAISEITVLVTVLDSQQNQILSRPYRLPLIGYTADPQSNTTFTAPLGFELVRGQTWNFSITAAKGFPTRANANPN